MEKLEVKMDPETVMACLSMNEGSFSPVHSEFLKVEIEPGIGKEMLACEESLGERDIIELKTKNNQVTGDQTESAVLNGYHAEDCENGTADFSRAHENSLIEGDIEKIVIPVSVKIENDDGNHFSDMEETPTPLINEPTHSNFFFQTDNGVRNFPYIGETEENSFGNEPTHSNFIMPPHGIFQAVNDGNSIVHPNLYQFPDNNQDKPYKCPICGKGFTRAYGVTKHQRSHTGEKPYTCEICNKSLYDYTAHKVHMRTHTGEKPYTCHICNISFSQKQHLRDHILIHANQKPYSCEVCGKTFRCTSSLKLHSRVHTGEKPYTCQHCKKNFARLRTLKEHVLIHTGDHGDKRPFTCGICDKVFNGLSSFRGHMRSHGEGKLCCDVCGKKFLRNTNLLHHRYIHTGEKPYTCEYCSTSFRRKTTLHQHLKMHTGTKPYACQICGHAFKQSQHLKIHMTTHSGIKPHCCTVCGKSFTLKYRLRTHMLAHLKTSQAAPETETTQVE